MKTDWNAVQEHLDYLGLDPAEAPVIFAAWEKGACRHFIKNGKPIAADVERVLAQHPGRSLGVIVNPGGTKKSQITQAIALFTEDDSGASLDQQMVSWQSAGMPEPSLSVFTGNKSIHHYWVLAEPITPDQFTVLQRRLAAVMQAANPGGDADSSLDDPCQVMRVAGAIHPKTGKAAEIRHASAERFLAEELTEAIAEAEQRFNIQPATTAAINRRNPVAAAPSGSGTHYKHLTAAQRHGVVIDALKHCPDRGKAGGGGYPTAQRILAALVHEFSAEVACDLAAQADWSQDSDWDIESTAASLEADPPAAGKRSSIWTVFTIAAEDPADPENPWICPWQAEDVKRSSKPAPPAPIVTTTTTDLDELDITEPTADDLESQFPLIVQDSLFRDSVNNRQHWISVHGQPFRWNRTHYERIRLEDLQRRVVAIAQSITVHRDDGTSYHPFTKPRCIEEALKWFRQITSRDPEELNPTGLINCRNGVVRIVWNGTTPSAVLEPHNPAVHFFIDPPGLVYDPCADPTHANELLKCLTPEGRKLFLQILAATLDVEAIRKRGHRIPALMLIGDGQNGKDTLREAISSLHGSSCTATISISDWQQYESGSGRGRFSVAPLDRARLSIASENSGAFKIDNLQWLKAAITGDPIPVERKGIQGTDITPRAVFLFFLNSPPLLDGGSAAILSRWAVAHMPHSYSTTPRPGQLKADPRFKHDPEFRTTELLPALLNMLIDTLGQIAADGFDLDACAADLQQLRENTSHLHQFLRDAGYSVGGPTDCVEARQVWDDLQRWYKDEGWMQYDRSGDLVHVETGDGDKPVKAARLLPKRLTALHPCLHKERGPAPDRRAFIYGLRHDGPKSGGKWEANMEPKF